MSCSPHMKNNPDLRIRSFQFGAALICWSLTFQMAIAQESSSSEAGFRSIFDGVSLNDWVGDDPYWSVKDGAIHGEITPETIIDRNRFLIYKGDIPADFELRLEYRISGAGNSGINYRSEIVEGIGYYAMKGYQFDLDGAKDLTGSNYEERVRCTFCTGLGSGNSFY